MLCTGGPPGNPGGGRAFQINPINSTSFFLKKINSNRRTIFASQNVAQHFLLLVQVVTDELQAVDREPDPEPELCYLGMSIQENLMEKARIGITLLLEEEPTEDNIFVTGYTQE